MKDKKMFFYYMDFNPPKNAIIKGHMLLYKKLIFTNITQLRTNLGLAIEEEYVETR